MAAATQDLGQKYTNDGQNFTPTSHSDTYPSISPHLSTTLPTKSALITGASKGLGLSIALSLARSGTTTILLAARSPLSPLVPQILAAATSASRPAPTVLCLQMDVTSLASVEACRASVQQQLGEEFRLDVLVNNAGSLTAGTPLADSEPRSWWADYETSILGAYNVTRTFMPLLLSSRSSADRAVVINMTSIGAHFIVPGFSSYSVAKLAVCRLTEFLCVEYGAQGVTALCVHPGGVRTELALNMPEFMWEYLVDTEELCGDGVAWLAGEAGTERGEWLGGRYVSVKWDVDELMAKKEEVVRGDLLKVRLAVNMFTGQ
ncbi:oxidoreductase-like protein [Polyplosphaeria fusca]|uniref:Oxidoreductase-like protein n=1 Tax=Polyplosphaeria fusca TaxID=682080 RepID=A0A9P4QLU8_9PLEO|nr:oxidoreductase-like protein [Polyplosphaeria fusca]